MSFLQRRIALIEGRKSTISATGYVPTGHDGIDHALGGGLMRARLHELMVDNPVELGSGAGFAAVLAGRLGGELIWLREADAAQMGRLHATGIAEIGGDPAHMLLGVLPNAAAVLRAAADAVRCAAAGAVVVELWRNPRALDLTASRRLALMTAESGVTALLLRVAAKVAPSAAQTRIRVSPAPSLPLVANAPGYPAWTIELLRQRGRPEGGVWRVEWDREHGILRDQAYDTAAISGAVPALSDDGSADAVGPARIRRAG